MVSKTKKGSTGGLHSPGRPHGRFLIAVAYLIRNHKRLVQTDLVTQRANRI